MALLGGSVAGSMRFHACIEVVNYGTPGGNWVSVDACGGSVCKEEKRWICQRLWRDMVEADLDIQADCIVDVSELSRRLYCGCFRTLRGTGID